MQTNETTNYKKMHTNGGKSVGYYCVFSKVYSSVYPVDHRCSVDADLFIRFPVWTEIF